jgi:Ser/Thr protein kinase RdoA (MazF antagonist)
MTDPEKTEPSISALERLAMLAFASWGRQTREVHLIKMRENAVFRVADSQGGIFAMRIHREGYHDDEALGAELKWMAALRSAGVEVPTVVPAENGRLFVKVRSAEVPVPRQVDLFEWIEGGGLGTSEGGLRGDLPDVGSTYRVVGGIAASLHDHAAAWPLPAGFRRHHWDREGLVGEKPFWGRFWDLAALEREERALLVRARDRVRVEMTAFAAAVDSSRHYGLIHADMVPENLLVSDRSEVRLIDFDDAGFGWHLFDLATALYFIQDSPDYELAKASLIEGYRARRPLSDAHLAKLPVFMAARGFTYLGWAHTRPATRESLDILPHVIRLACREAERLLGEPRAASASRT